MGGRGASSGISDSGKKYGTEYHSVLKVSNIKFLRQNASGSVKAPMETMTKGRVYVTIDSINRVNTITYYDTRGKRTKSINLLHAHKNIKGPHTHVGYIHDEQGTRRQTKKERAMIEFVTKMWENKHDG